MKISTQIVVWADTNPSTSLLSHRLHVEPIGVSNLVQVVILGGLSVIVVVVNLILFDGASMLFFSSCLSNRSLLAFTSMCTKFVSLLASML